MGFCDVVFLSLYCWSLFSVEELQMGFCDVVFLSL